MVSGNFLSPGEVDIIETAKAKKKLKAERKQLDKAKEELKPETAGFKDITRSVKRRAMGLSKGLGSVLTSKGRNPFGRRPEPEDFTKEQHILRGMFGHGEKVLTNMDGRGLPRLDNTLNSGGGLLKSGDSNRETAGIFGF